jgi:hypothetical protein
MSERAAHLVDSVLPHVPVRQWVLTVPHGLRYRMAHDPSLTAKVLNVFVRAICGWLKRRARKLRIAGPFKTGAVTVIQRFDSALALNVHFHSVVLDGVYALDHRARPIFHPTPPPTDADVAAVATGHAIAHLTSGDRPPAPHHLHDRRLEFPQRPVVPHP